jgi:hypothetical protein
MHAGWLRVIQEERQQCMHDVRDRKDVTVVSVRTVCTC